MKNILYLLDYYMPNASPNGVCVSKLASTMVNSGWNVSILCFGNESIEHARKEDGIEIYRCCDPGVEPKHTFVYATKFYFKWLLPSKYPITERKNVSDQFYKYSEILYSKYHYDVVVAVHLPVETLIASIKLKEKHPQIKILSYMLDSLSGGFVPRFIPEQYSRKRKLHWENCIFQYFDKIILMQSSKNHHDRYSTKQEWYKKSVFLDIPLLTVISKTHVNLHPNNKVVTAFCGLLNFPYRNVKYFLSLIERLNDDYKFVFAGKCNIQDELNSNSSGKIEYLGQISHAEVESLLSRADILLNLGVTVPSAISGKIFEYMSYGKPIISTYSIDNEACIPYLRLYPLALLIDERNPDIEQQARSLQSFIDNAKDKHVPFEVLNKEFYNNTPEAFMETITNLCEQ